MSGEQRGVADLLGGLRNALVAVVALILVVGVGIGVIAFKLFGEQRSSAPGQTAAQAPDQPADGSTAASARCDDLPRIEASSWELTRDGPQLDAQLSSDCPDGDTFTGSAATLTASSGTATSLPGCSIFRRACRDQCRRD